MRLLYFHAKWCGPCKELNARFMGKAKTIAKAKVERFDFDKNKERPLFNKFDVHSIPTLMLVDENNEILWSHSGSDITLEQVEEKIQSLNKI